MHRPLIADDYSKLIRGIRNASLFAFAFWLFVGWLGWHVYRSYNRGNPAILEVWEKIDAVLAGK